jgi:hypothetical protein
MHSFSLAVVRSVAECSSDRGGSLEIQFVIAAESWAVLPLAGVGATAR